MTPLLDSTHFCLGSSDTIVSTPPFAESVTEGDVKWEIGKAGRGYSLGRGVAPNERVKGCDTK